jgi:hypothetical protein
MVWYAPITWLADQLVKQDDLNQQLRDNLNVLATPVNTSTGKIIAIDATRFESLDGSALTGVAKLAGTNTYGSGKQDFSAGRVVLPVGSDRWAT